MLVWRLNSLLLSFFFVSVKHSPSCILIQLVHVFSDAKPVTSAACDSPHRASAAPGLFRSSYLRKVESISV